MKNKITIIIFIISAVLSVFILVYSKILKENYLHYTTAISSTILNITAQTSESIFNETVQEIIKEIERIDFILNPYNKKSEIALVNKESINGKTNIIISKELYELLRFGKKYSEYSGGEFDITVRLLIELWGFGIKENQTAPKKIEIENAIKNTGVKYIDFKENTDKTISLILKQPVQFDLGSYGKGYILSKMIDIFKNKKIENFLIDYGGDTYSLGVNPKGNPWTIAIRKPRETMEEQYLMIIKTTNAAIVTSGDYERFFTENGVNYHHIINAKTGMPSDNAISSTIVTDNPADADALSTLAFLLGKDFFTNKNLNYKEAYIVAEDKNKNIKIYSHTNK